MFQADFDPKNLDRAMRNQLADSLQYIFDGVGNRLDLDLQQTTEALNNIRKDKVAPSVFARYYDLVFALDAKKFTRAQRLIQEILNIMSVATEFEIMSYSEAILADDYQRFPRLVFAGYSGTNPMATPDQALTEAHTVKLQQAIDIIRTVDKAMYLEIKALILWVIITINNDQSQSVRPYAGASSFMTWGAIFINARLYESLYQVVEFYVHELTHCVLFGYSCDKPLVLNPVSECYQSQLRTDPRPMDGIYHSTLVCARLALFMHKWQAYGAIDDQHAHWLQQQHRLYVQKFFDGASIINQKAKLSEQGSFFFKEAESRLSKYL